jgi:hypothetical protein
MRRLLFISSLFILFPGNIIAQKNHSGPEGKSHLASLDIHLPVGVFARSHVAGAGLNYSWSNHRFGMDATQKGAPGLVFNAGADYYFGKKIKPAGYSFHYRDYLYLHAMAGILFNTFSSGNISFTTGPALGIYNGNSELGFSVALTGNLFLTENIAVGPGIVYRKQARTEALWSGVIRLSYSLK